jgi:TolB-like protein/Tfp pilus assembly protein PilF
VTLPDIFLSYNREDQAVAQYFAEAFERAGLSVWWDVALRSGETYDTVTEQALRSAKAVVVLWSPRSVVSRWVRAEATIADRLRTLVPATIEPCDRPIMFELTQTADLTHWQGDTTDRAWCAFVEDVRRTTDRESASTRPATDIVSGSLAPSDMSKLPAARPSAPAQPARGGARPTLAVLPFTNRSGQAEDEGFAEVLVEDLTGSLSQGHGLRVLAHSTMRAYHDQVIDIRAIGRDHGADYVLEGNVRRVGALIRTATQLVDAQSGAILWTGKFDRPTDQVIDLLDEIVDDVNAQLYVQIQRVELNRAARKSSAETMMDALKRCWGEIPRMSIPSIELAVRHARRALEFGPDNPIALSTLGMALGLLYQRDGSRRPELLAEALQHCERALLRDGQNFQVLFLASLVKYYAQDWDGSRDLAERAVEVNPKSADALQALGGAYTRDERYAEAIEFLDRADRLCPYGFTYTISLINRCWALYGLDRFDDAIAVASEILKIMPSDHTALMLRPVFYAEKGELELARRDIVELRRAYPDEPLDLFLGTIRTSRQSDAKRARNAELFEQVWLLAESATV